MLDSTAVLWAAWFTAIVTISAAVAAVWLVARDRWTHLTRL